MSSKQKSMATPYGQSQAISKSFYVVSIIAVALIGFVVGTRSDSIMQTVGPVIGIKPPAGQLDLSTVQRTYSELYANYDGELNKQALIDGASRGLVAAAGDEYTVFMDAKEAKAFSDDLSGEIGGGIGAEIGVRDDQPTIIRTLEGNPAQQSGLLAGDIIREVNGESMIGKSSSGAANKIRGEVGTTVKVIVSRGQDLKNFSITRQKVTNPSVYSSVKDGIGKLTISRFDGETGRLARAAAQDFKRQGVRGVILDLRGNGGGYLGEAQDVAGIWLDKKVVVSERAGERVIDELKTGSDPILAGVKTIVLVDGGSASASEIVAGALQDHGAATLVGEKTFGKGTVQKMLDLGAGTQLKVTIARWYTPNGKNITKDGIAPDQKVAISFNEINAGKDPQLDAAIKILK